MVVIMVVVAAAAGMAADVGADVAGVMTMEAVIPLKTIVLRQFMPVVKVQQASAIRCGSPPMIVTPVFVMLSCARLLHRMPLPHRPTRLPLLHPPVQPLSSLRLPRRPPLMLSLQLSLSMMTIFSLIMLLMMGGWELAYGDEMMEESSGRSILTPQHNKTTTAHAAATGVLQDQGGYDSVIVENFTPPPVGAFKGNLPPGFFHILDDILALYAEQPCVNSSASNIDAFGKSTLKGIIPVIPHVWCPILRGVCSCLPQGRNALQDHGQPPCCSWGRVVSLSMGFCADRRCCFSRLCFCRLRRSHHCRRSVSFCAMTSNTSFCL